MFICPHISFARTFLAALLPILGMLAAWPSADARPVRVATYNVLFGVGSVGSTEYNAVRDVLTRVDADVIAFQELQTADRPNWEALAAELGYTNSSYSAWTTMAGNLYNAYFSRYPIVSSLSVLSPPGANEITRPPLRVVIDVPDAAVPLVLWTLHHKASGTPTDEFRRAIESYRCAMDIESYLDANPTHQEYIVLGDMNDDVSQSQTASFSSLPSGLPGSYSLGADITFPVYYATFPRDAYETAGSGMVMLNAFQTGTSNPGTYISSNGRLDYIFVSSNLWANPLGTPVAEVYNSNFDDGINGLPKSGSPLPASTSSTASDHYLVFADIQMTDASLLGISPATGIQSSGLAGGPFSPGSWTYVVTNPSSTAVVWGVEVPTWVNATPTGGLLEAGADISVDVTLSALAVGLDVGSYSSPVRFIDHTSGGALLRQARLDVLPEATLGISPVGPVSFFGQEGGPYSPMFATLTLTNTGFTPLAWAGNTSYPVEVSPMSGNLEPGTSTQLVVSISMLATNLPQGINIYPLSFTNLVNGRGSTNLDVNVVVLDSLGLFENGETGGAGWTASGLWHQTDTLTSACAKARSGSRSWWYGLESNCTYNTGGSNTGSLTSPEFVVPPSAYLTYWSWEQTEGQGLSWDKRLVQISTNSGTSWVTIYQSGVSTARWQNIAVNLSGYAMKAVRLRFVFDTVDDFSNNFPGWYLDDIRVAPAGSFDARPGSVRYEGGKGGPFTPGSYSILITNTALGPVTWTMTNLPSWAAVNGTSGFLEPLAHTNVIVTLNGNSAILEGGLYASQVMVRNTMNSTATNILVELLVRDSLPDDWRFEYFNHIEPRADDLSRDRDDPDEDGYTNWEEYVADTNPLDEDSFFSGATGVADALDTGTLQVELSDTKTNRLYDLMQVGRLENGEAWQPMGYNLPGTGGTLLIPVTNSTDTSYFRPAVMLP